MDKNELTAMTDDELMALREEADLRIRNDTTLKEMIVERLKQAHQDIRDTERDRFEIQMEIENREAKDNPVPVGFVGTRNTIIARRAEIDVWAGDPWYPVLRKLDEDLTELMPDYSLDQLKEKFSGLRFYTSYPEGLDAWVYDKADRLIRQAELDVYALRDKKV